MRTLVYLTPFNCTVLLIFSKIASYRAERGRERERERQTEKCVDIERINVHTPVAVLIIRTHSFVHVLLAPLNNTASSADSAYQ